MHWAAKSGDVELMSLLHHYGATLDDETLSESRMRPIHWGASDGKISTMRFLLDHHVDLNSQDSHGCTPVIIAAQNNQIPCVIFLIKNGANLEICDMNGDSTAHWAAYKGYNELLGVFAYLRPQDLLLGDTYGQTPLHLAALKGYLDCVDYLVNRCGCDPLLQDRNGSSSLDLAIKKGHSKIEWILRKASSPTIFHQLSSLGIQKLCSPRTLVSLCCGSSEKEMMNWPWRVVFFSNLIASIVTAYIVTDSNMNDLYLLHTLNLILQGLWWFCFSMCLFVSPGLVIDCEPGRTHDKSITYESYLDTIAKSTGSLNEPPYPLVCHSCHVRRPIRAKHCKIQNQCIHKFDHFCPFVGNTVGRDNYKYFVSLLFLHLFCGAFFEVTCYWYSYRVPISWSLICFMIYSLLWVFALMGLLNFHISLISASLTTNEYMGLHKYPYLKDENGQLMVPFDRSSFWNNLMEAYFPTQMAYYSREEYIEHERPDMYIRRSYSGGGTGFRETGDESERALLLV
jgi:palmitoyltransferase ZDHHC13/17